MIRFYSTKSKSTLKSTTVARSVSVPPPLPFKKSTERLKAALAPSARPKISLNVTNNKNPITNSKVMKYIENKNKEAKISLGDHYYTVVPQEIKYEPIPSPVATQVATLKHNLDRVLFSPGVHYLQDPRTRVYNFTPFLKKIMPVSKFDFNCIAQYITASKDTTLLQLCKEMDLKFFSSTSSMTSALTQFHFWLSNDRPASIMSLSKNFHGLGTSFSSGTKCPTVLMCKNQDGVYSIDSDKSSDKEILLSLLGHSMEKLLTTPPEVFNKYDIANSHELEADEINKPESYHYSKIGNFLMRSQLDCFDPRLPGTGTFDLKTRAVCAVRHDIEHTEKHLTGYKIFKSTGTYESFEREFFELTRSALLKYSLQARIGNMDGIFVCYHNIQHIFGFQYLSLQDIDAIFHSYDDAMNYKDTHNYSPRAKLNVAKIQGPIGSDAEDLEAELSSYIAESEFKASVDIWSQVLTKIADTLNQQSFRLIVKNDSTDKALYVIATPMTNDRIDEIQKAGESSNKTETETELSENEDASKISDEHRQRFQEFNQETAHASIGFKLTRKHFFNGKESNQVYYKPSNLTDKWEIRYDIRQIPNSAAVDKYLKYLKEKEKIVWGTAEDDSKDQIREYMKILRAYGEKGKLREEIWKENDERLTVWEPIQNDKNVTS